MSNLTRNLRDGELVLKDGTGTPKTLTVLLDEGDLSWTETLDTKEISDRGALDHTRPGNEVSCQMDFSTKWTQLIQKSVSSSLDYVVYEFIDNIGGGLASTSGTGQQFTLKYEFTVDDPAGVRGELITFAKVYKDTLTLGEGDEYNTIRFSGRDFETKPTITRAS